MDAMWKMIGFVPVRDGVAARRFYEAVLGMRFVADDGFAVVMEAHGTTVRLVTMGAEFVPVPYTICGWEVPEIEAAVARLVAAGGDGAVSVCGGGDLDGSGWGPDCLVQGSGWQCAVGFAACGRGEL